MKKWIVSKFGGSSVRDGSAMLRCSQIIENNPLIKLVVISATQNTTNQLEYVAQAALRGDVETLNNVVNEIVQKHLNIAHDIFTSTKVISELEVLFGELREIANLILKDCAYTPKIMDQLYSLGEKMSSLLMSDLLRLRLASKQIRFIDAGKIIKTDSNFQKAEPNIELIEKMTASEILPFLDIEDSLFVTQGFIGEDLNGNTTTLGREGSDYSAALFGEAINAEAIQIWTDVQGIASSDPRIVPDVVYLPRISYDEATALASLGAKVLFPTTLLPAKRKSIPVYVGSSLDSLLPMTIIENRMQEDFSLKAVTIQRTDDRMILSFVGTHFDLIANFKGLILSKLNAVGIHYDFFKMTPLSISFSVTDLDTHVALRHGHNILKDSQ
jgi:aspartate kinase